MPCKMGPLPVTKEKYTYLGAIKANFMHARVCSPHNLVFNGRKLARCRYSLIFVSPIERK